MQIKGFVIGLFLYVFILLYSVKMSMEIIFFLSF
nr:MAG TPA_asm: transmembrane protein [Bacteriophage sp.]